MIDRCPSSRSQSGSVTAVLVLAMIAGLGLFLAASWVAGVRSEVVRQRWTESLGSLEDVLTRYPHSDANGAALEVERLTAAIGIDIATRSFEGRRRPTPELSAEHKNVKGELGTYLTRQLESPRQVVDPPPAAVAAFIEAREAEIAAVRSQLIEGGLPEWELQLEKLWAAPIPNLLGHIDLQKLLMVHALTRIAAGDGTGALSDLEASWRLNAELRDDPILISQLVAMAIARIQAGSLRKLERVPEVWSERLFEHDFRASFIEAMRFEAWHWLQVDDPSAAFAEPSAGKLRWALQQLGKPYTLYCMADISDAYRRRLARLDELDVLCDGDLSEYGADLDVPVPRWNLLGEQFVPNLRSAVDRLRRLELDLELTAKLLRLGAVRRSGGDATTLPDLARSAVCPDDRWIYDAGPGSATLAFSREISWPDQGGAILPTRFVVER